MTELSITGQTAIVTGGGTGIGRGIASSLAEAGVRVVVSGRRLDPLMEVVAQIEAGGGQGLAVVSDVTIEDSVEKLVSKTLDNYETVDIVVSNAGVAGGGQIHEHNIDAWDQVMAINLRGPFLLARYALPVMRAQNSGHFIHISSESGIEYYPGNGAYGVSKHALNALGEYVQRENQSFGIRVDTICPGMVLTPMSEKARGLDHAKCLYPEDVADLAMWLVTRRPNVKIGRPLLIQTMENPWE